MRGRDGGKQIDRKKKNKERRRNGQVEKIEKKTWAEPNSNDLTLPTV